MLIEKSFFFSSLNPLLSFVFFFFVEICFVDVDISKQKTKQKKRNIAHFLSIFS